MDSHFHGYSRDRIANKVRRGSSTVSREIEKYKIEVNSRGLHQAAEAYGVSQIVDELHDLSVELAKNKLSALEAKRGVVVADKLMLLQVEPDGVESFITNVYSRSTSKGYSPSDIVDQCSDLQSLETTYKATFEEIKKSYETMGSKINSLREEVKQLQTEKGEAEKKNAGLWEQNEVDRKDLELFNKTKNTLKQFGLNIEDTEKTKTVLVEIKRQK